MYIKVTGALLILLGCGGFGIVLARNHRREVAALHQLADVIQLMICELEFRLTPLPDLCHFAADHAKGSLGEYFHTLAALMDQQTSADASFCIEKALCQTTSLPSYVASQLRSLGQTLGHFDLTGQVDSLKCCRDSCHAQLAVLEHQQSQRLRSYQTLGFCAGAAMAILLF